MKKPRSRVGPPARGGGFGDAQDLGGFFDLQPHEIAQLDQFGLLWFQRGKPVEGIIEGKQLVVRGGAGDFQFIYIQMERACSAAPGMFAAGAGNKNPAHGLGGGTEKVCAVLPRLGGRINQLEPRFMYQRRRLERVAGGFAGHLVGGQAAQFIVNQRQQFLRAPGIALLDVIEDASDVAHGLAGNAFVADAWVTAVGMAPRS